MIALKYRIDFVRLDGEAMPSSENIIDGSTCYIIDTGELFIFYKGTWYNSDVESGQNENQQSENNQKNNETTKENIIKNDEEVNKTDEIPKDVEVIEDDK